MTRQVGTKEQEIKITPEMIEGALDSAYSTALIEIDGYVPRHGLAEVVASYVGAISNQVQVEGNGVPAKPNIFEYIQKMTLVASRQEW